MLGKKILAGLFAGLTLIKLAFLLTSPETWLGATQAFLGHATVVMSIYLVLLVITAISSSPALTSSMWPW